MTVKELIEMLETCDKESIVYINCGDDINSIDEIYDYSNNCGEVIITVGEKTTVVNAHTLTGFDTIRHSSCVDPKNYSEELGKQYAMEEVVNDLWAHLGFVLQWAKYGLKK